MREAIRSHALFFMCAMQTHTSTNSCSTNAHIKMFFLHLLRLKLGKCGQTVPALANLQYSHPDALDVNSVLSSSRGGLPVSGFSNVGSNHTASVLCGGMWEIKLRLNGVYIKVCTLAQFLHQIDQLSPCVVKPHSVQTFS